MSNRRPLSTVAWVLMSKPMPAQQGLERVDDIIVSIHAGCNEAEMKAKVMKRDVFRLLGEDVNPFDHWVSRLMDYRDSIHVRRCDLREIIHDG